jgi:hypothetical protein
MLTTSSPQLVNIVPGKNAGEFAVCDASSSVILRKIGTIRWKHRKFTVCELPSDLLM